MVGVPGRSKSCKTCKERKKGVRRAHMDASTIAYCGAHDQCDRLLPSCSQCRNAGLLCAGYSRSLIWVGIAASECISLQSPSGLPPGIGNHKQHPWNVSYSRQRDSSATKSTAAVPSAASDDDISMSMLGRVVVATTPKSHASRIRRGHFKSRLGCLNCKRTRIKCNELHPTCLACHRLGLACAYATTRSPLSTITPTPGRHLSTEDMLFYHRFLTLAYPSLPLRGADLWTQVAAMSHENEYLAHAILGLGASHLSQNENANFTIQALQHRVLAIVQLNKQFMKEIKTAVEADALFAAVTCLISQSALLDDGMGEYLSLLRGISVIMRTVMPRFPRSRFHHFTTKNHLKWMKLIVSEEPKDASLIDQFKHSAMMLNPLCEKESELGYLSALIECAEAANESSYNAWKKFAYLIQIPSSFAEDDFSSLVRAENHIGRILNLHMFLLEYLLGQFCLRSSDEPKFRGRKRIIIRWTQELARSVSSELQGPMQWPLQFCEVLVRRDSRYLLSP